MSSSKNHRIDKGINGLVSKFLVKIPGESREDEEERRENSLLFVREVLESHSRGSAVEADVHQASDLIKKRLIQTNSSPEKALRYSNLYSKLLAIPAINQKWAVLYFLYQLGDNQQRSPPTLTSPFTSPVKTHRESKSLSYGRPKSPDYAAHRMEKPFKDAFAPEGIKKLPAREGGQRDRKEEEQIFAKTPAAQREDVSVKAALLAENYVEINPSEATLLRELPFTLQGLSSTNLKFSDDGRTLTLPPTLPVPILSMLHTLAEPALLYKELSLYVQTVEGGLLGQSLRAAISGELRLYLGLVATLEGQIRRALAHLDENEPRGGLGKAGVTLRRCVIWTRDSTSGLRLMSLISEESKSKRGGQLISLIHSFSISHGDPMVGAFAERLLAHVTRPFYDMLRQWIYDGELSDPHHEFFVSEQDPNAVVSPPDPKSRGVASSVWEDKYKLNEELVPSIITQDFAQKVFLIGKSLNFIRHGCGDSEWVEEYSKAASKELRYGDTATLEDWIDQAYKTTMARLIHLMSSKFHLFAHLKALKNYILLGQGDFIALLMESLSSNLDRPAGAQYRHTLTAQLEHAIRHSNAQYDSPEVLRRLDARMLQLSHGDIGWDCFTLEYKIDAPVDVVVTEWGNRQYLKVFNFLWRIKRVEFALSTTWRKCMTGARGVLQNNSAAVSQSWKSTRGVLAEMIHFIGQLQYYILFEVIESSWDELESAVNKEGCTLDDLIGAHSRYLEAITHKGLLGAKKRGEGGAENTFMSQLSDILAHMLNYRDAVDGLYSWSVADFTVRQGISVRAERREDEEGILIPTPKTARRGPAQNLSDSTPGLPGLGVGDGNDSITDEFPVLVERLQLLGASYKKMVCVLLGDLAYQPDVDMRFLGVVMNFNDVYQATRRKSRVPPNGVGRDGRGTGRA